MTRLALAALGLAVAFGAGAAHAAKPPEPRSPNDSDPSWSWDTRRVGFDREEAWSHETVAHAAPVGHGGVNWILAGRFRGWQPGGSVYLVEQRDTTWMYERDEIVFGSFKGRAASWSPDGRRIAFLRDDGLYVVDASGDNSRRVHEGVARPSWDLTGPVWSPDAQQIAVGTTDGLLVVDADGRSSRIVFSGANQSVNPSWSPDGSTIAFERNNEANWAIWLVDPNGGDVRQLTDSSSNSRFPQWGPFGRRLSFISDRLGIRGEASPYRFALYTLDVDAGRPVKLLDDVHPDSPARWSPTGAQIAVAAGQECLRWGIYVVAPETHRAHRVTNDCHIDGTARPDVLRGKPHYDIIAGFGGNDTIYARDGVRDSIDCGAGRDTVYADRIDALKHCERAHRA